MTSWLCFRVPGEPRGQGRPRFARIGDGVRAYKDRATAIAENVVLLAYVRARHEEWSEPWPHGVRLCVGATFLLPKSRPKWQRECADRVLKVSRPDADNVAKTVLDALNKVAWVDDAQVVDLRASKGYGPRAGLAVGIERLSAVTRASVAMGGEALEEEP